MRCRIFEAHPKWIVFGIVFARPKFWDTNRQLLYVELYIDLFSCGVASRGGKIGKRQFPAKGKSHHVSIGASVLNRSLKTDNAVPALCGRKERQQRQGDCREK